MAHKVTMPQMGYDMTEGTINRWHKKEGDAVARGDSIASIATDKADIDVEAFAEGVLRKIVAQPGQTIPVGDVIAWIGTANEVIPEVESDASSDTEAAPLAGQVVTRTEAKSDMASEAAPVERVNQLQSIAANGGTAEAITVSSNASATATASSRVKSSPYARKRAGELGVDVATVAGSGPGGRIVALDIEKAAEQQKQFVSAGQRQTTPSGAITSNDAEMAVFENRHDDPYRPQEVSRLRRAVAKAMVEAKGATPHFYLSVDVDALALIALRAECNALGAEIPKLSITDFIVRACSMTLQSHPQLNASWDNGVLRQYKQSNVAIAVALTDGLVAPALRNCENMSMRQLATVLHDLVARAKSNALRQDELSGAHIAVSNLGMFGIDEFSAIITPPQSSVLAVGATRDVPVVRDGAVVPGKVMRLTLSIDHRVTDGAQAAEALSHIKWLLEHPAALLV